MEIERNENKLKTTMYAIDWLHAVSRIAVSQYRINISNLSGQTDFLLYYLFSRGTYKGFTHHHHIAVFTLFMLFLFPFLNFVSFHFFIVFFLSVLFIYYICLFVTECCCCLTFFFRLCFCCFGNNEFEWILVSNIRYREKVDTVSFIAPLIFFVCYFFFV